MSFINRKISKNLRADIMRSQIIDRASFEPNAVSIIYSRGELDQYFDLNKTEYTVEVLNAYSKTENTVLSKKDNSLFFEKIRYFEGNVGYNFSFIESVAAYNYSEITFGHSVFEYMLNNREKADALNLLSKNQITNLKYNANLRNEEDSLAYITETHKTIGNEKTPIYIERGIVKEGDPIGLNKYVMEFKGNIDLINGENVYLRCFTDAIHKKVKKGDIFDNKSQALNSLISSLPFKCNCLCTRYNRVFLGEITSLSYDTNANKIYLTLNYQIQEDDKTSDSSKITWLMFPKNNFSMANGIDHYGEQKVYTQTMEISYINGFEYYII